MAGPADAVVSIAYRGPRRSRSWRPSAGRNAGSGRRSASSVSAAWRSTACHLIRAQPSSAAPPPASGACDVRAHGHFDLSVRTGCGDRAEPGSLGGVTRLDVPGSADQPLPGRSVADPLVARLADLASNHPSSPGYARSEQPQLREAPTGDGSEAGYPLTRARCRVSASHGNEITQTLLEMRPAPIPKVPLGRAVRPILPGPGRRPHPRINPR